MTSSLDTDVVGNPIIERDRWCVFCRGELIRTRFNRHWRHLSDGFVVCVFAWQQGRWPSRRRLT